MADFYYGRISFPKSALPLLTKRSLPYNWDELTEPDQAIVELENEMALNGKFEDLEAVLVELGVPFDRYSMDYAGFPSEYRYFRPGVNGAKTVDHTLMGEEPMVPVSRLRNLLDLSGEDVARELKRVIEAHDPPIVPLKDWLQQPTT